MQLEHSVLIELIKEQLTIQEAAETYTSMDFSRVRGNGNTINVKCPFHEDRSPSFTIWLDSNRFKCHAGCGHGDQIDLVAAALQIDLKEAVKLLADNFGLLEKPVNQQKAKVKAEARQSDRLLVHDFQEQFSGAFQRMVTLERLIEDNLKEIKNIDDLYKFGDLYHIRDSIGYLLDCMVNGEAGEQIGAFIRANEVLNQWQT